MATMTSPASLSELDDNYQVLTELHRTPNSRTYLARHLELNRDVTITVVRAAGDTAALERFAADVERLKTARHANVIPVIEGRWLGDDTFAVVRARVRGSSLDQLVSAVGPVPLPRVATTLGEVSAALDWARTSGIGNRTVSPDAMIFQQGSGRVLLAMDPAPPGSGAIADICNDTRTLGRLAWAMLAGRPYADASATPLGHAPARSFAGRHPRNRSPRELSRRQARHGRVHRDARRRGDSERGGTRRPHRRRQRRSPRRLRHRRPRPTRRNSHPRRRGSPSLSRRRCMPSRSPRPSIPPWSR